MYWGFTLAGGYDIRYTNNQLSWPIVQIMTSTLKLTGLLGLNANNADELSLELEHRVGRDGSHTPSSISPLGLDGQCSLLAGAHVQESLVPSLDNLSLADVEGERLAAVVAGVELGAVFLEGAAVVDVDLVTWRSLSVLYAFEGCFGVGGAYRSRSSWCTQRP